jgi:hypothetical protein
MVRDPRIFYYYFHLYVLLFISILIRISVRVFNYFPKMVLEHPE